MLELFRKRIPEIVSNEILSPSQCGRASDSFINVIETSLNKDPDYKAAILSRGKTVPDGIKYFEGIILEMPSDVRYHIWPSTTTDTGRDIQTEFAIIKYEGTKEVGSLDIFSSFQKTRFGKLYLRGGVTVTDGDMTVRNTRKAFEIARKVFGALYYQSPAKDAVA